MSAEINVFLDDGAAHVKWVLNGPIDSYDSNGNPLYGEVQANEIAAALNGLWTALEAAGRKPSAIRKGGGGNPNWKPKQERPETPAPDDIPVPTHCGKPMEYKPAWHNEKTGKDISSSYQCRAGSACAEAKEWNGKKFGYSLWEDKYRVEVQLKSKPVPAGIDPDDLPQE